MPKLKIEEVEHYWRSGAHQNADASLVAQELKDLIERNHGRADCHQILEFAEDPTTETNKCFEWDDRKAAYKFRLQQADQLAGSLAQRFVAVTGHKREKKEGFRSLVFLRASDDKPEGYRFFSEIVEDDDQDDLAELAEQFRRKLRSLLIRNKALQDLIGPIIDEELARLSDEDQEELALAV